MKINYIGLVITLSINLLLVGTGCATIETRHQYTPQKSLNWKKLAGGVYQFECNRGEVQVSPIVLKTSLLKEQKIPWIYVNFRRPQRIENCDLSFVTLENEISGEVIQPIKAETNILNDNHLEKKTTYCYYYFDIEEEKKIMYSINISENVFGCKVDPITYKYDESTQLETIQW